jgi:RHS repeat-associated protein
VVFHPTSSEKKTTVLASTGTWTGLPAGLPVVTTASRTISAQGIPYIEEPDTKNSCSVQANSSVSIDSLSLKEKIPVVGAPFVLSYSSDAFRPNIFVDQKLIGLGGWKASIHHSFDPVNNILYLGTGEHRTVAPRPSGNEIFVPNSDGSEVYYFDQYGRHTRTRGGLMGETKFVFGYSENDALISITDRFGNVTSINQVSGGANIVSPYGQVTSLKFDSNGFLSEVTNPNNETYKMLYTDEGYLTNFTKPGGQTSSVTYDEVGYVMQDKGAGGDTLTFSREGDSTSQVVEVLTALNRKTKYTTSIFDDATSARSVETPDGARSTFEDLSSDVSRRQTSLGETTETQKSADPRFGDQAPYVSQLRYGISGSGIDVSQIVSVTAENVSAEDPFQYSLLTKKTTYQSDDANYSTSVFNPSAKTLTSLSPMKRSSVSTFNDKGQLTKRAVGTLLPVLLSYNSRGQLSSVAQGDRLSKLDYDSNANLSRVTDPLGRKVDYAYDLAGRLVKQTNPDGSMTQMSYDANGNVKSITPAGRPAHSFDYNLFELVSSYLPPSLAGSSARETTYLYNQDKQLTRVSKADGSNIDFTYNETSGNLVSIQSADGRTDLSYLPNSKLIERITAPNSVEIKNAYEGPLLSSVATTTGSVVTQVGWDYNSDLSTKSLLVSSSRSGNGAKVSFMYDKDHLPMSIGDEKFERNENGLVTKVTLGKLSENLSYNSFGELMSHKYQVSKTSSIGVDYRRDSLGRVTKRNLSGAKFFGDEYAYDAQGRLTSASGITGKRSYKYDSNGNRISMTENGRTVNATYDVQDRLITYGDLEFKYNENGELIERAEKQTKPKNLISWLLSLLKAHSPKKTTFEYDASGNLKALKLSDGRRIDYVIDGQNRRVGMKVNGRIVRHYIYQSQTQVAAELDGSGKILKQFVYGMKQNVPDYMIANGKKYRIISDQVGTPKALVDTANMRLVRIFLNDEFGKSLDLDCDWEFDNSRFDEGHLNLPFGFAGGLKTPYTNLVHFGAREYDPEVGRWISKDPIGFNGGDTNLYGFVVQDPVNQVDSSGTGPVVGGLVCAALEAVDGAYNLYSASVQINALTEEYQKKIAEAISGDCPDYGREQELKQEYIQKKADLVKNIATPSALNQSAIFASCLAALLSATP